MSEVYAMEQKGPTLLMTHVRLSWVDNKISYFKKEAKVAKSGESKDMLEIRLSM